MKTSGLLKFKFPFSKSCTGARPLWLGFIFSALPCLTPGMGQELPWLYAEVSGALVPQRTSANDSGTVAWRGAEAMIQIRCFSLKTKSAFTLIRSGLSYKSENFQVSRIPEKLQEFRATPSVSMVHLKNKKHFWLSRASLSFASGEPGFSGTKFFPSAILVYNRNPFRSWGYTAGIGYSYIFGKGLAYPVLGVHYSPRPGRKWQLILPLSLSYRIRHNNKWRSRFALHPSGGLRVIQTRAFSDNNVAQTHFLRSRSLALSYFLEYRINRVWTISGEWSALGGRRIWITNPDKIGQKPENRLFFIQPLRGWQAEIRIRYRLFTKKEASFNPIPKDAESDLDQISPEDLPDPDSMDTL